MADYEGNGDFNYNTDGSDFKRARDGGTSVKSDDENEESAPVPEKVNEYIRELLSEKANIDHKYPNAEKLIDAGTVCLNWRALDRTDAISFRCGLDATPWRLVFTTFPRFFIFPQKSPRSSRRAASR